MKTTPIWKKSNKPVNSSQQDHLKIENEIEAQKLTPKLNEHSTAHVKIQNTGNKEKTISKCKKLKEPEQSKVIKETQKQSHNWKNSKVALKVEDAKKITEPMSALKTSESITQKCEDRKENRQKQQSSIADKASFYITR